MALSQMALAKYPMLARNGKDIFQIFVQKKKSISLVTHMGKTLCIPDLTRQLDPVIAEEVADPDGSAHEDEQRVQKFIENHLYSNFTC